MVPGLVGLREDFGICFEVGAMEVSKQSRAVT